MTLQPNFTGNVDGHMVAAALLLCGTVSNYVASATTNHVNGMEGRSQGPPISSHSASLLRVSNFCAERALKEALDVASLSSGPCLNLTCAERVDSNLSPQSKCNPQPRGHSSENGRLSLKRKADDDDDRYVSRTLKANVFSKRLQVEITTSNLKHTPSPWRGLNHTVHEKTVDGPKPLTLNALLETHTNMKVVPWNGKQPMKIVDIDGRIIVHLAGRPHSKSFNRSMRRLDSEIHAARLTYKIPSRLEPKDVGIRGDHPSGTYGYTYPSSVKRPSVLMNGCRNTHHAALSLETSADARRVKYFQADAMKSAAPRMHQLYCETDRIVRETCPQLEKELQAMVPTIDAPGDYPFASTTYNFGPQTQCRRHCDCMNLPCGWCAITSMGSYNPRYGGHMVLWELGLIIEFPPHSTILIPSALITHSNTSISQHESRMSIVRYSAGGLFMWVSNGCRPSSHPFSSSSHASSTLQDYLDLFMTVEELENQRLLFHA